MSGMKDDDMEPKAGADMFVPANAAVCSLYDATCYHNPAPKRKERDKRNLSTKKRKNKAFKSIGRTSDEPTDKGGKQKSSTKMN